LYLSKIPSENSKVKEMCAFTANIVQTVEGRAGELSSKTFD